MKQKTFEKAVYFFVVFLIASLTLQQVHHLTPRPPPSRIQIQETPIQPPRQQLSVEQAATTIKSENLKKLVYYLASEQFGGRVTGTEGNNQAAQFIKGYFQQLGLKTQLQPFSSGRGPSQNVMAYIEGTTNRDEIVVIGAHMDGQNQSVARSGGGFFPSADDNASGTVAVLEIAKAFVKSNRKFPRTLLFQCYSGEEQGLVGSRYYANNPLFPKNSPNIRKHVFMINLDMIGYYKNQNVINAGAGGGASDHVSFHNKGVPCVFVHTGLHSYYHTPQDTPDKLNYVGMEKVTQMAFTLAWSKAESTGNIPQHGKWQRVTYKYDHGNPAVEFEVPYFE